MLPEKDGSFYGRKLEFFHHDSGAECGYEKPQTDTFALLHPKNEMLSDNYPLYVVFHSAGHDVYSTIGCIWQAGNHDIYHTPENMFGLYLDCRQNSGDWWWGGLDANGNGDSSRAGTELQPVERRSINTILWVLENYPIDKNRVYGVGNSMGGSGVLGIGLNHGDIFAAIKANVPAGVRHAADRCCLDTHAPKGFSIPDPPVVVDYSAQNDCWSNGHEVLYNGMREKKYALYGYWGMFGHENNNEKIYAVNDLVHSLDIFNIKRNQAYPVFCGATTDDLIPWNGHMDDTSSGQVNSFFRWENIADTPKHFEISLYLITADDFKTRVVIPSEATADVSLRRLQSFKATTGMKLSYEFGERSGYVTVGEDGIITLSSLTVTAEKRKLKLTLL